MRGWIPSGGIMNKRFLYAIGVVVVVVVIVVVLIASCGKNGDGTTGKVDKSKSGVWEYSTIVGKCEYDKSAGDTVCAISKDGGLQYISSLLNAQSAEGWELVSIYSTRDGEGSVSTFIFKRKQ